MEIPAFLEFRVRQARRERLEQPGRLEQQAPAVLPGHLGLTEKTVK
jgi:hypothetical protein